LYACAPLARLVVESTFDDFDEVHVFTVEDLLVNSIIRGTMLKNKGIT
jgi:hypothetical protein